MDDEVSQLVRRATGGDGEAFARLVGRFERAALAVALAVCGEAQAAGDVVQEAFLRAWRGLGELDDPARFGAWLVQIVRNLALDERRARREHQPLERAGPVAEGEQPPAALERAEERRRLDAALAGLDEMSRVVVALRYYDDLSSKQIGELVGLTAAAVDMRLSRARTELRRILSGGAAQEPRQAEGVR